MKIDSRSSDIQLALVQDKDLDYLSFATEKPSCLKIYKTIKFILK